MNLRIVPTPLTARSVGDWRAAARAQSGRRFPASAAGALLAAGDAAANRDRLLKGGCLAVTTGQQAGLFTGPLFSIHKALSAAALARELEADLKSPVVPVFWVAGDDHDFAEINHCTVVSADGQLVTVTLRDRAAEAPMLPAFREPVGPEGAAALTALEAALPPSEFRDRTIGWLRGAYAPDRSLAEAYAVAMAELLAPFGVVVCRGWDGALKRAAAPQLLGALDRAAALDRALADEAGRLAAAGREAPIAVGEGLSLVMIEGRLGRDRLKVDGKDTLVARRSGESFTMEQLRSGFEREPERLSANVLLRGAVEAGVLPTVAYMGGPGELAYIAQTAPVFEQLGTPRPAALPRFAALLVEAKVDKVLEKHGLAPQDLARPEPEVEGRIAKDALPPEAVAALGALRQSIERAYEDVIRQATALDQTLEKSVQGARNQALGGTHDVEKKLVAAAKRRNETTIAQVARARTQLFPQGKPQERVITVASFLARHGPELLQGLFAAARAHARSLLEAAPVGS